MDVYDYVWIYCYLNHAQFRNNVIVLPFTRHQSWFVLMGIYTHSVRFFGLKRAASDVCALIPPPPLSSWDTTFHYTLCTFIVHLIVCFAKRSHFRLLSLLSSLLLPSYILIIATNISSIRNMTYHSSVRLTVFECSRAQQLFKNNVYVHGAHFCFSIIIIQIGSTLFVLFCPPFRPVPFCIDKFGGIFRLCANDIYIYIAQSIIMFYITIS